MDTRLRVGRSIAKTESEGALEVMQQIKERYCPKHPPAFATDGHLGYPIAITVTWGTELKNKRSGKPCKVKSKASYTNWAYIQIIKNRKNNRLVSLNSKVVFGKAERVKELLGEHTSYVERTNLTSRHINGRLVRKTLSFSKKKKYLKASCEWEDAIYNFTRTVDTLKEKLPERSIGELFSPIYLQKTPAMAAKIADKKWTIADTLLFRPPMKLSTHYP